MVTIQNLALLRQRGQGYLVGLKRRRNQQVNRYIEAAAQGPWQECPLGITALEKQKVPRTMVTEIAGEEPGVRVFVVQSEERLAYERAMRESAMGKTRQLTPEQLAQRAQEFDMEKSLDQLGKIVRLEERLTGYGLIDALNSAHSLNRETEMSIRESVPREALEFCDKLEMLEVWDDLKPSDQHDLAQELAKDIQCLHALGIVCFAGKQLTKLHLPNVPTLLPVESNIDWIQAYLLFAPVDYQLIQS